MSRTILILTVAVTAYDRATSSFNSLASKGVGRQNCRCLRNSFTIRRLVASSIIRMRVGDMPEAANNLIDGYCSGNCRLYLSNLLCKSSASNSGEYPQGAGVAFTQRHKTPRCAHFFLTLLSPFIACLDASFACVLLSLWHDYMFHAC